MEHIWSHRRHSKTGARTAGPQYADAACSFYRTLPIFHYLLCLCACQTYGWTDGTIALFTLWGNLDFPVFFLPSAWLLARSLRVSVLLAAGCCATGALLRCIPLWSGWGDLTSLCHVGRCTLG